MNYEYSVMHPSEPQEPHRGPMSKEDAENWIENAENDGIPKGMFYLAVRSVSDWREVH